ncbi:hypothetical protein GCM10025768_15980 [Microbacterium pseudoresistens]|uniref:Uncharacterized protein n=1 Tax=Microbacterium pseudoresistens TaxID=640634 RepID=A0A7Y9ESH8_9MICO|nr:hypothetical protein [Microbacterium pseudoresistens]NYD53051.1 hypothetical protein [Microbacterium pseudoresistens]
MPQHKSFLAPSALVLVAIAGVLVGCAPTAPHPESSASSTPTPTVSASAPPESAPSPVDAVITLDALEVDGTAIAYTDHEGVIAALGDLLGSVPAPTEPDGMGFPFYDWGSVRLTVPQEGPASVWIGGETDDVRFSTAQGIALGASRADALAAGAQEIGLDEDGDGIGDYLAVDIEEVPNTTSLVHPGQVGVRYVMLAIDADVVTKIFSNANDYADL